MQNVLEHIRASRRRAKVARSQIPYDQMNTHCDALKVIAEHLHPHDLLSLSSTSRQLRDLSSHKPQLFRYILSNDVINIHLMGHILGIAGKDEEKRDALISTARHIRTMHILLELEHTEVELRLIKKFLELCFPSVYRLCQGQKTHLS